MNKKLFVFKDSSFAAPKRGLFNFKNNLFVFFKNKIKAFSLVEIMISLIVISMLVASFAPVITKKISASTIKTTGANLKNISVDCAKFFEHCTLCIEDKKCIACNSGYYAKNDGSCGNCRTDFNAVSCSADGATDCDDGYYINPDDGNKCTICPVGHKCDRKAKTACPAGYYQASTGKNYCDPCEIGKYQNETGQTSCKSCSAGYYQDQVGQSTQKKSTTRANCTTYSKTSNTCAKCSTGYYLGTNNESCEQCAAGNYCSDGKTMQACSAGQFALAGASSCSNNTATNCYEKSKTANACASCAAGYAYSSGTCSACAENKYATAGNTGSCADNTASNCATKSKTENKCATCANNYEFSGNECVSSSCSAGYYKEGDTCTICPKGYACADGVNKVACDGMVGQCASSTGATSCSSCPQWSALTGSQFCVNSGGCNPETCHCVSCISNHYCALNGICYQKSATVCPNCDSYCWGR